MALQCLNIVAMFVQNIVIIDAVQSFLGLRELTDPTEEEINLREWLRIEVYLFIALIAACIIFLFVRAFTRHQIEINIPAVIEHHQRDFLDQNLPLFSLMQAFAAPFLSTLALIIGVGAGSALEVGLCVIQGT